MKTGLSVPDSLCTIAPSPQKKSEKGCLWGRGRLCISSSSLKTANNKIPLSSVFNDSEGLYRKTVCRCLVLTPHYSAQLMRFRSRGLSRFFSHASLSFCFILVQLQPVILLRHCIVFCHKWPFHDLVFVIPPPPLIKVASNTRPCLKLGGTSLNGREEGGQYYNSQTFDQERFEARQVIFSWECLNIFATGRSKH